MIILHKWTLHIIIYHLDWSYTAHSFVALFIICLPHWNVSPRKQEILSFLYLTVSGPVPGHGSHSINICRMNEWTNIITWNTGQNESPSPVVTLTQLQTVNCQALSFSAFPTANSDSELPTFLGDRHGWNQLCVCVCEGEASMTVAFSFPRKRLKIGVHQYSRTISHRAL